MVRKNCCGISFRKNRILTKLCGALLTAALLASTLPAFPGSLDRRAAALSQVQAAGSFPDHTYLTENNGYKLYVNEEDLSLVVEDKTTGAFLESAISYDDGKNNPIWLGAMRSAVVLTMINKNDDTKQADLLNDAVTKQITYTDNGFSAKIYWNVYQLGLTLNVSLTEDGLVANIPEDSIREDGDQYFIGTIRIYPFMGHSYLDDKEGYMLVPDGNGALIYLNDKEGRFASGFSGTIYGTDIGFEESKVETLLWDKYNTISDPNQVLAPIYGIAHVDDEMAFLGIVEDGQERAAIEVMPNGVSVDYNRAYARFVLRKLYTQPTSNNSTSGSLHIYEADRSHSDLQVRFLFLSGKDASYAGMAASYRDYLLKNGLLSKQDTSYRTRVDFLGTERQNWVLGTQAVVMTTAKDVQEILGDLNTAGVTDLLSVYKGWQSGGLYDLPLKSYDADRNIGGNSGLTNLIKKAEETGVDLYLYDNALLINPEEQNATFNVIKQVNKKRYEYKTYADVYETFYYLTPMRSAELLAKLAKSCIAKGANKLCVAGVSEKLFTFTYQSSKYTRFDSAKMYGDAIADLNAQADLDLILEQPFAYLWKDTSAFLDMPLYTSNYILEDESIPFLSMVLAGTMPMYADYVNFEANEKELCLKMIESGCFPSFYITKADSSELIYTNSRDIYSSRYETYRDRIISYSEEYAEFAKKVTGAVITDHKILEGDIRIVTYSNNVKVYLNYSEETKTVDGKTLNAMSYLVVS